MAIKGAVECVSRSLGLGDKENSRMVPAATEKRFRESCAVLSAPASELDKLLWAVHCTYREGDYVKALEHIEHARGLLSGERIDVLYLEGAIHYQLRNFDKCILKNMAAVEIDPHFAECYASIANALKEKEQDDMAVHYFLMAIQVRPTYAEAWADLATVYMRKGLHHLAIDCCQRALSLKPQLVDAHSNLGQLLQIQGYTQHAYVCYIEALKIQPSAFRSWLNLGGLFMEVGDYQRALVCCKEGVRLKPDFVDAHLTLGNLYKLLGSPQEALACYKKTLQFSPDWALAHANLASLYYEQGELELAVAAYKEAIVKDPSFVEAYNNMGNALRALSRGSEAVACYQACLILDPSHPQALTNLGNMYLERDLTNEAFLLYKHALVANGDLAAPYSNLAAIYKQAGRYETAILCYTEALRINPMAVDCVVNRGNTFKEMGRVADAIKDYLHAILLQPTMAEAHANLASAYKDSGHVDLAIASYEQALELRPEFPEAVCNLLHTRQCVCDWASRDASFKAVEKIIRQQITAKLLPAVQPFHAIAYPLDPLLTLDISKMYAQHCELAAKQMKLPPFKHPVPVPVGGRGAKSRLRVGYVSSDFGNHPLAHLMSSVFGLHNRETLEVFCYPLSPDDGSEWRQRIAREVEHFVDVSTLSVPAIAQTVATDGIHILVNLNGYTKGARNELFALRPAPIQVSYMGFPGTTGAKFIDYLVTDEIVSPPEVADYYSEKLVYVPHCYFVNDYKRANRECLSDTHCPSRADLGLPEDKFIFCCFNQLYKIDPDVARTWCNILKKVPNSILWLLRFPAAGEKYLRQYMEDEGIPPERIIFTNVASKPEHIRRAAAADLFLDTPLCNAHTTGTDVLWSGCPMITLPLQKMATRVAASLCHATGLGKEMVVSSMEEYEKRAVYYATNRTELENLTKQLRAVRQTCALFDTERWVKNLDGGYHKMWQLHCTGHAPRSFRIRDCQES